MIPNTNLRFLSGVNISPDGSHTLYFDTETNKLNFFLSKVQYVVDSFMVIKGTTTGGTLKVELNIHQLNTCSYLMFQNATESQRWYYAFIVETNYINDGNTEVVYRIDNMMTWFREEYMQQCFIDREHSIYDNIGSNLIPEGLELGDYILTEQIEMLRSTEINGTDLTYPAICMATSVSESDLEPTTGDTYGDVFTALEYYVGNEYDMRNFITRLTNDNKADAIVSMFMVYKEMFPEAGSVLPKIKELRIDKKLDNLDGYVPKNKKLFTYPYNYLSVTTCDGNYADFKYEYFKDSYCNFRVQGVASCNPSIVLSPYNYNLKDSTGKINYNEKISLSGFPLCGYNIDSFKAWIAQNGASTAITTLASAGGVVAGIAGAVATGGASAPVSGGAILAGVQGLMGVASSVAQVTANSNKPPQARGSNGSNEMFSLGAFDFLAYPVTIRNDYARIIDTFFTKYGYKTNFIKVPNIKKRPAFNFTKTIDCQISGDMPASCKQDIISIFNTGVTFWKNNSEIGDYTIENGLD